MLRSIDPFEIPLTFFITLNWFLTFSTAAAFVALYYKWRFLFIKPSIQLLATLHLLFQWPLAFYAGQYEIWLPRCYDIVLLVHGVVIIGLALSIGSFNSLAKSVWSRVAEDHASYAGSRLFAIILLCVFCAVSAVVYLSYVPLNCTGLYALIFDPGSAPLAREMSGKLLVDSVPRYTLSFLQSSAVPLVTAFVAVNAIKARRLSALLVVLSSITVLVCWTVAMLGGAKSILVSLTLVVISSFLWCRLLSVRLYHVPVMAVAALLPAIAITIVFSLSSSSEGAGQLKRCFEQGKLNSPTGQEELFAAFLPAAASPSAVVPPPLAADTGSVRRDFVKGLLNRGAVMGRNTVAQASAIFYRAGVVPLEVGGWYVHYLQTHEPIGIGGIPKLGRLFGAAPVDLSNVIGLTYGPEYYGHSVSPTISASTGFLFSYYAYFGLTSIPVIIAAILALDLFLFALLAVHRAVLLPLVAALTVIVQKFAESDFTVVFLSHGLVFTIAFSFLVSIILLVTERHRQRSA